MWNILKRKVKNRISETMEELILVTQEEWGNISLEEIRILFCSIPNRLAEVVSQGGGPTKYWVI